MALQSQGQGQSERTGGKEKTHSYQELLTLRGHSSDVYSVAFSPDGKRLATASWDRTVQEERQGDLLGDARTAPIGIALLHFDDRMNEIYACSFRAGLLPTAIRGEEHPVLLLAQDFVKP